MKEKEFAVNTAIGKVRKDYFRDVLLEENCEPDPFSQMELWLAEALEKDSLHANAMTLSTVTKTGMPDARIVLLRNISYGGFTFYTNYNSAKAQQIDANAQVCLSFFWKELERQVKIQGEIRFLPVAESDAYFKARPFESQVGAWASQQSKVISGRATLDAQFDAALVKYEDTEVPRPDHWGGYVVLPSVFEFWQGRNSRLHDRIRYTHQHDKNWKMERLMP
ncbi:pyridoxamine 5'-phosphate oxidase [Sphingobacteriaceae bacterium]|nr:pyridoxamine 5'-phosphate oxidase [Sphingobacteriaceae bacterium]